MLLSSKELLKTTSMIVMHVIRIFGLRYSEVPQNKTKDTLLCD